MSLWTNVTGLKNGERLDQVTLNRPLRELRERTDYLYQRLTAALTADTQGAVKFVNAPLETGDDAPVAGDFVYIDPVSRVCRKALADADTAAVMLNTKSSGYAIGMLVEVVSVGVGTVVLYGKQNMVDGNGSWTLSGLLEDGVAFRTGPYWLSGTQAGKMTAEPPDGPTIYLGFFIDDANAPGTGGYAVISPQAHDFAGAHVHQPFSLYMQPAGSQTQVGDGTPFNTIHEVHGFDPWSVAVESWGSHTDSSSEGSESLTDSFNIFGINNLVGLVIHNIGTADSEGNPSKSASGVILSNGMSTITANMADADDNPVLWEFGDRYYVEPRQRLIVVGDYLGVDPVTYTLQLQSEAGGTPLSNNNGFDDVYLYWSSSDPDEGSGHVRVTSFEQKVAFGTKGLFAILENATPTGGWSIADSDPDPYTPRRRSWTVTVPTQTRGWLANKQRKYCVDHVATDGHFSLLLFGQYSSTDSRLEDTIKIFNGILHQLDYSGQPMDGDTITIQFTGVAAPGDANPLGTKIFEFDSNGIVTNGHVVVQIDTTAALTYQNLVQAVMAEEIPGSVAVLHPSLARVYLGTRVTIDTYSLTNATLIVRIAEEAVEKEIAFPGGTAEVNLLVYDSEYKALFTATDSWWGNVTFWTPVTLSNGLQLMAIPYDADNTPMDAALCRIGDYWQATILDPAPGAKFVYAMGMHQALSAVYPTLPASAAALVINGVEAEAWDVHEDRAVYRAAKDSIYWYLDMQGSVPWPVDWVSTDDPGTAIQLATYYTVRMRARTTLVSSIRPGTNSPLRFTACGTGENATTGDLEAYLDLNMTTRDYPELDGYMVVKAYRGTVGMRGPVVSRIIPGPGLTLRSSPGAPEGTGVVELGLATGAEFSGDFEEIALENAKQEMIGMFPYIRLLAWTAGSSSNIPSAFVLKFQVPYTATGRFQLVIYATVFGEEDIAYVEGGANVRQNVGIEFSYNVLRDYAPANDYSGTLIDNLIAPPTSILWQIPLGNPALANDTTPVYKAFNPMVIHTNPYDLQDAPGRVNCVFSAAIPRVGDKKGNSVQTALDDVALYAGSQVAIRLRRTAASSNPYTGRVGFLKLQWRLIRV